MKPDKILKLIDLAEKCHDASKKELQFYFRYDLSMKMSIELAAIKEKWVKYSNVNPSIRPLIWASFYRFSAKKIFLLRKEVRDALDYSGFGK